MNKCVLLFLVGLMSITIGCKTDIPEMAYQQEGYSLSPTDSLINRTYDFITFVQKPDYAGEVLTTLMHRAPDSASQKAVLYIHGYGDYYFQYHVGEFFRDLGYHFYALELRKYGRSLLPHQKPNYTRSLKEYFPDIDRAIDYITTSGQETLVINGHSTGGLTASLYAAGGNQKDKIDGLILNSPFFAMDGNALEKAGVALFAGLSRFNKQAYIPLSNRGVYGRTIHQDFQGEWNYNFAWKPITGFPIYYSWLRAIKKGHKEVKDGLELDIPILVLRSDSTFSGGAVAPEAMRADAVLNVSSMQKRSENLGTQVTIEIVEDAMHDVFLSTERVREDAFRKTRLWLMKQPF